MIKNELKLTSKNKVILKQNLGITLIALVVTIIILLILAGVAITELTSEIGNNITTLDEHVFDGCTGITE